MKQSGGNLGQEGLSWLNLNRIKAIKRGWRAILFLNWTPGGLEDPIIPGVKVVGEGWIRMGTVIKLIRRQTSGTFPNSLALIRCPEGSRGIILGGRSPGDLSY